MIAGLIRYPDEIGRHSEALTRLAQLDPKAAPAIESLIELSETLDSHGEDAISQMQGQSVHMLGFGFAKKLVGLVLREARDLSGLKPRTDLIRLFDLLFHFPKSVNN